MINSYDQQVSIASIKCVHGSSGQPEWAHVSGWAQLSGSPRKVSCVVTCCDSAMLLTRLLPELSDLLTEAGFPWEITCVDGASSDGTAELLAQWSELPGFRWIRLERDYGQTAAMQTGLRHAIGDAVILVSADADLSAQLLPDMIEKWDEGNDVVVLGSDGGGGLDRLVCWNLDAPGGQPQGMFGEQMPAGAGQSMLLDRRVVDLLLQQESR